MIVIEQKYINGGDQREQNLRTKKIQKNKYNIALSK
jgi:hypothetical protein